MKIHFFSIQTYYNCNKNISFNRNTSHNNNKIIFGIKLKYKLLKNNYKYKIELNIFTIKILNFK